MSQRRAGILYLKINGGLQDAKGNFTYNIGRPKREAIVGATQVTGYKAMPQVAFIEGELTDSKNLDLAALLELDEATVTLELANGKTIVLRNAWYAGDGNVGSEDANIQFRIEAQSGEEVK